MGIMIILTLAILGGAIAVPAVTPALLAALGFGKAGIVAGSLAATWHSKLGMGVGMGWRWFAAMQSAGMAGFHVASYILLGLAGGAAGGGVAVLIAWLLGEGDHCGLDAQ